MRSPAILSGLWMLVASLAGAEPLPQNGLCGWEGEPAVEDTPWVTSAEPRPHVGFSLSPSFGMGELYEKNDGRTTVGRTTSLQLRLGMAVTDRLIVFAEGFESRIFWPVADEAPVSTVDLYGFGPGLKYYLEPNNLYLSGSLLFSRLSRGAAANAAATDETSYWGMGGRFAVGDEWWISPHWAVGLAGEVFLARMRRNPDLSGIAMSEQTAMGFSLLISSSYNYPGSESLRPLPSSADPPASETSVSQIGYHVHDGIYVGASLGWGWFGVNNSGSSLTGTGLPFALSLGFAPSPSLAVFGEFYQATVLGPDSAIDRTIVDLDIDIEGWGPGFKFYYEPRNVFVSASLLLSQLSFHTTSYGYPNPEKVSDWGMMGRVSLGEEWWVSADWGVGLAAELLLGRMTDYTVRGISLNLSASFN